VIHLEEAILTLEKGGGRGGGGREAGGGRGASLWRTYESLRTAAQIVLHYYVRGGGEGEGGERERERERERGRERGGAMGPAKEATAARWIREDGGYVRSIKPPRNYPLCIA